MIKFFVLAFVVLFSTNAVAGEYCDDARNASSEFCESIKKSREALDKVRELLDRSKDLSKKIEEKYTTRPANPGR